MCKLCEKNRCTQIWVQVLKKYKQKITRGKKEMEKVKDDWCRITLAVRPEKKEMLTENARLSRRTLASYILRLSEKTPIYVINGLPELISELGKIGKNFNQLVRIANTQKFIDNKMINDLKDFKKMISDIDRKVTSMLFVGHINQPSEEMRELREIKEMIFEMARNQNGNHKIVKQ
jgi:beta-phosphoglucomutase-like phosphatase (HAD superfamily)